MEFDFSKENIQPLRGGRNPGRLEVALQAQCSEEYQRELQLQKEKFENLIRNYEGDDPLDNWYQYICWVEQSYPKHGHEGNLIQLLEDCLAKFENDKSYTNDFRFCKLWIKYIDSQPNPLELYHMMHARGLCLGCADLYRAWAYYHEAAGDYRSADLIFQLGKRECAQPYEELTMSHQNMIFAAGQQVISGVNEQRLLEQRQALTTLRPYMPGKVGSERVVSSSGPGVLPSTSSSSSTSARSNIVVSVYEEASQSMGVVPPPNSIISVARRQIATKENTIAPGAWTTATPHLKGVGVCKGPKFSVHVDGETEPRGLILPNEYYTVTHEDFSHWKPLLYYEEPEDPQRFPMYPKAKVYCSTETEFSIEEIRATRYLPRTNVSYVETAQAIQSILGDGDISNKHKFVDMLPHDHIAYNQGEGDGINDLNVSQHHQPGVLEQSLFQNHNFIQPNPEQFACLPQVHQEVVLHEPLRPIEEVPNTSLLHEKSRVFGTKMGELVTLNSSLNNQNKTVNDLEADIGTDINLLWRTTGNSSVRSSFQQPSKSTSKFSIYEESNYQDLLQPKGSAMKSAPFKVISDEDLAETGSRGGHEIAAAAQPGEEAKRIVIFEDESNSSLAEMPCNTQVFNFNLNAMKVSTPQSKNVHLPHATTSNEAPCKQLFSGHGDKQMSTIVEET